MDEQKKTLRRQIRAAAQKISRDERRGSDDALFARFLALREVREARSVLAYYGVGAEPETVRLIRALLDRGCRVSLPRCLPGHTLEARVITDEELDHLIPGKYGIPEPDPARCPVAGRLSLDIILAPGLAFDRQCNRLGQGGGYYDRFLPQINGAYSVGLCRERFLLDEVPHSPLDWKVDLVCTEDRTLTRETGRESRPASHSS